MARIKHKSGFETVYQTKKNFISPKSMQAFARVADRIYSSKNSSPQPKEIPNLMETGFKMLQDIFKTEYIHSTQSRFCWDSTQTQDMAGVNADVPPTNIESLESKLSPTLLCSG